MARAPCGRAGGVVPCRGSARAERGRDEAFVADLTRRLDEDEVLLVHCGAGIGRAGTVAVCVLMALGVPAADAQATVAANRPMAGPEVGAQRELIAALERMV